MPAPITASGYDAGHPGVVGSAVRRQFRPSGYRFGYHAAAFGLLYLWIVVCTAILDAFAAREGPDQYMRWVPDKAGHLITAPTSLLLGKLLMAAARYVRTEHGVSIMGVAHSPYVGATMMLLAGTVQAPVLYLLLRGPRRKPQPQPTTASADVGSAER